MNSELEALRAELARLQQDRDRLESEVNLWRTRYFELVAQSLGSRQQCPQQGSTIVNFTSSVVSMRSPGALAMGKGAIVA